jgi:hypothetical protein
MQNNNGYGFPSFFNATTLLWVAVGLAVFFIGLLVFDFVNRRKKVRRLRGAKPETLKEKLLKPIQRARAFKRDLRQILDEHARRKRLRERRPQDRRPDS